jgi:hypothetical protein
VLLCSLVGGTYWLHLQGQESKREGEVSHLKNSAPCSPWWCTISYETSAVSTLKIVLFIVTAIWTWNPNKYFTLW